MACAFALVAGIGVFTLTDGFANEGHVSEASMTEVLEPDCSGKSGAASCSAEASCGKAKCAASLKEEKPCGCGKK